MKIISTLVIIASSASVLISCGNKDVDSNTVAAEANDDKLSSVEGKKDAKFIAEAVAFNHAEIRFAKLAQAKSDNALLAEVAKSVESQDNVILHELQESARRSSISVPVDVKENDKKTIEKLMEEKNPDDFNKRWCSELAVKQEDTIRKFEERSEKTEDEKLKMWIDEKLPILRAHLDKVNECEKATLVANNF